MPTCYSIWVGIICKILSDTTYTILEHLKFNQATPKSIVYILYSFLCIIVVNVLAIRTTPWEYHMYHIYTNLVSLFFRKVCSCLRGFTVEVTRTFSSCELQNCGEMFKQISSCHICIFFGLVISLVILIIIQLWSHVSWSFMHPWYKDLFFLNCR